MWVPEIAHPQEVHITPVMGIRRERVLLQPGEVVVNIGATVEPDTVVARTRMPGPLHVLNAADVLRVMPDQVKSLLNKPVGEAVEKGETLAEKRKGLGLHRRRLQSPVTGTLVNVDDHGYVLVRDQHQVVEITASVNGRVTNVMPRFGVVIELVGALIQGAWGTPGEGFGMLKRIGDDPGHIIEADSIDVSARGTILVGGTVTGTGLRSAVDHHVRGMILGSLDVRWRNLAMEMPYPVILLEGFGSIPISQPAFELLVELNGQDVTVDGQALQHWGRIRPEVIISRPRQEIYSLAPAGPWQEEDIVHLLAPPYQGQTGEIVTLLPQGQTLPTGEHIPGCQVKLESGETVFVPWTNMERIR